MERSTVSYRLALHLLSTEGDVLPLNAELHYSAEDPLAVEAHFDDGSPDPVRWVFARDLLATGMKELTGDGDVVIWPTVGADGEAAVQMRLNSPHGDALLEASASELDEFLAATWRLVPPGTEHRYMDVEDVITALLGEF
jgi:hypothetical protein